jgi:low temperature requirement protein LtrA
MDGKMPARVRGRQSASALTPGEGATTFELFFDLVYVFTVTQVTELMVYEHDSTGGCLGTRWEGRGVERHHRIV